MASGNEGNSYPLAIVFPSSFQATRLSRLSAISALDIFAIASSCHAMSRDRDFFPRTQVDPFHETCSSFIVLPLRVSCSWDDRNCIFRTWIGWLEHNDCYSS